MKYNELTMEYLPGRYYHIYNKVITELDLFETDIERFEFLEKMKEKLFPIADILAYALIPNHFHICCKLKTEEEIKENFKFIKDIDTTWNTIQAKVFRGFIISLSKAKNARKQRIGSVFKHCVQKKIIAKGSIQDLLKLILYIHHNPLKHGLVKDFSNIRYNSFNEYLTDSFNYVSHPDFVKKHLETQQFYISAHQNYREKYLNKLRLESMVHNLNQSYGFEDYE